MGPYGGLSLRGGQQAALPLIGTWNLELAGTRYDVCPLLLAKIYETQFEVE